MGTRASLAEIAPGLRTEGSPPDFGRFNRLFALTLLCLCAVLAGLYELQLYMVKVRPPVEDYMATLRESTVPGCSSFGIRKPSLLMVGDSHTGAEYNFNEAVNVLGRDDIGECALQGFRMKSWSLLIPRIERDDASPKVMFFGTSPLMFFPGIHHFEEQLAEHRKVVAGSATDQFWQIEFFGGLRWVLGAARNRAFHKLHPYHYPQLALYLDHNVAPVEASSDERTEQVMRETNNASRRLWNRLLALEVPARSMEIDAEIDQVCRFVTDHAITFYVIASVESPFLQSLYSPEQRQLYRDYLERFRPCAKEIITDPSASYGLGNRHYINRAMRDDFPYDLFREGSPLPTGDVLSARKDADTLFDLDHINLIGATRYTRVLLRRLIDAGLLQQMGPTRH